MEMRAKRRWFQFSLRALVVLMLLVSLVLGYWGYARRRSQRQWEAVRVLQSESGQFRSKDDNIVASPTTPGWQKWLGVDCPQELKAFEMNRDFQLSFAELEEMPQLEAIYLRRTPTSDEDLVAVAKLPRLRFLSVDSELITDVGVSHIATNTGVRRLSINGRRLTARALCEIARLPHLETLHFVGNPGRYEKNIPLRHKRSPFFPLLDGCSISDIELAQLGTCETLEVLCMKAPEYKITGAGIKSLSRLNRLRKLEMSGAPIPVEVLESFSEFTELEELSLVGEFSPEDFAQFSTIKSLRTLRLDGTQLTSAGLRHIAGLRGVEELQMDMSQLKDEDLVELKKLSNLKRLDLSRSRVTDAGMIHLASLSHLENLILSNTRITDAGLSRLGNCKQLKWLVVRDTDVSFYGYSMIREIAPKVWFEPRPHELNFKFPESAYPESRN